MMKEDFRKDNDWLTEFKNQLKNIESGIMTNEYFKDCQLEMKSLTSAFIINNFVHGFSKYSYEDYLRDFLNASSWFLEKHPDGFSAPPSESNGECDAISGEYGIDFKLLASLTLLQAKNILEHQVTVITKGMVAWNPPKKTDGEIAATRIHAALRNLKQEDLLRIRNSENRQYGIEKDIQHVLMTMEVNKNLFLFFPYELYWISEKGKKVKIEEKLIDDAVASIKDQVNNDFKELFAYRKLVIPNCETYFSFLFQDYIIMFVIQNDEMIYIDCVNTSESNLFIELSHLQ